MPDHAPAAAAPADWVAMTAAPLFGAGRCLGAFSERRMLLADCGNVLLWPSCWEVQDARVLARAHVVACGGRLLTGGLAVNHRLLADGVYPDVRSAGDGWEVRLPPPHQVVDGPVLLVGGDVRGNYYHWLVDYFPRMVALARHARRLIGDVPPRFAVVAGRSGVAEDLLRLAGIPAAAVIDLDDERPVLFRRLVAVGNFTQYGFVHPALFEVLPPPPQQPAHGRRLYVSRADAASRRVLDEDAVMAALRPFGVERVTLGGLPLAAQRDMFAEAELVIGPHGAGLANLLWTPPGCGLIELRPAINALWHFERLCQAMRRPLGVLRARAVEPGGANADLRIEPERVAVGVRRVLATRMDSPGAD